MVASMKAMNPQNTKACINPAKGRCPMIFFWKITSPIQRETRKPTRSISRRPLVDRMILIRFRIGWKKRPKDTRIKTRRMSASIISAGRSK